MRVLLESLDLNRFFRLIPHAPQRLLLVDVEGVLLPALSHCELDPACPSALATLHAMLEHGHTRVIMFSERAAQDVANTLRGILPVEILGCNGVERLSTRGTYTRAPLPHYVEDGLRQASDWCAAHDVVDHLQITPTSVSLDWGRLPRDRRERVRAEAVELWPLIAWPAGLELRVADDSIALVARRFSKAWLVDELLDGIGEGAAVAYLGDGPDDENAFCALHGRGLGVLVAAERRETFADVWLSTSTETAQFLWRWHRACTAPAPHRPSPQD